MIRTLAPTLAWTALFGLVALNAHAESRFDREMEILAEQLRLAPGMTVADLGAGEGAYAVALAERVGPGGTVYATELDEERLATLRAEKEAGGLDQMQVVEGEVAATGLAPGSVEAALLRDVYHHVTAPEAFVKSLFETLRPGGRLVVVDFPPTFWLALWTPEGIPESRGGHGISQALLTSEFEAAGFVRLTAIDPWPSSNFVTRTYGVVFERP